jgi:hypothetical protein
MSPATRTITIPARLLDCRRTVGSSIWEYLWLLAHVTDEGSDGNGNSVGIVHGGRPVPTSRIAADLERSREATLANLERLEARDYIQRSADVGCAYNYRVQLLAPAGPVDAKPST